MPVTGAPATALAAMRHDLGAEEVGRTLDERGTRGVLEGSTEQSLHVRLTDQPLGLMAFHTYEGDGATHDLSPPTCSPTTRPTTSSDRSQPGGRGVDGLETEPTSP